jgi:hypothetical protein
MAACRVQFTWFGTKKSLTAEQKAQAAEPFDAEGQFLSAGKKPVRRALRITTTVPNRMRIPPHHGEEVAPIIVEMRGGSPV